MNDELAQLSTTARQAARAKDWVTVRSCARKIRKRTHNSAEGYFLEGLADAGTNRPVQASRAFRNAIQADKTRYDAAIELMRQLLINGRHSDAYDLFNRYEGQLENRPYYLEMAGDALTRMGVHDRASTSYKRAC